MTPSEVLQSLALPPDSLVGQRIPKTLLVEHGAPTPADKRLLESSIEDLRWAAALKPATVGIPAFQDSTRQAVELAVLSLTTRDAAASTRLIELLHRAIPYHTLLITASNDAESPITLSLADKRWAQGQQSGSESKVILDGDVVQLDLSTCTPAIHADLLASLSISRIVARLPGAHLYAVYRSWIDSLLAAQASAHTGSFSTPSSAEQAAERQQALIACAGLEKAIASLRSAAAKEKQMARQVELNLQLRRLQSEREIVLAQLTANKLN